MRMGRIFPHRPASHGAAFVTVCSRSREAVMRILGAAVLLAASLPVAAVEVKVMSAGAVKTAFSEAVSAWEAVTGHRVVASFAPAGELRKKVGAGEAADILIVPREGLPDVESALAPGARYDLGTVAMGVAVRAGAARPDIS